MKSVVIYVAIALLFVSNAPSCEDTEISDLWMILSAESQNIHRDLLTFGRDKGLDPGAYESSLNKIEDALNGLVDAEVLVSQEIELLPVSTVGEKRFDRLSEILDDLSEKYGFFVASEMCDLGARLRFTVIDPKEPFKIHLRLPPDELEEFIERARKLKLIRE